MIKILDIDYDKAKLQDFCDKCKNEGLINNSSFDHLKIDKLELMKGQYWIGIDSNEIFCISGAHHFPEIDEDTYRVQYRTAILQQYRGNGSTGIMKNLTNCYTWKYILPLQIEWIKQQGAKQFVITTNTPKNSNDPSGKMFKVDKVFHLLEKQGIVEKIATFEIYYTWQNVWKIIKY